MRSGETDWDPQVVLTNQEFKNDAVLASPYAMAYSTFRSALAAADRWLIVGYSFRDACINEMLLTQFQARAKAGITPTVLVGTYGPELSDWQIASHLGADPWDDTQWLKVHRSGVDSLSTSAELTHWAAQQAAPLAG